MIYTFFICSLRNEYIEELLSEEYLQTFNIQATFIKMVSYGYHWDENQLELSLVSP